MEPLSPRPANVPLKTRITMKKTKTDAPSRPQDKPINPDKIDDKWLPAATIEEPGNEGEKYYTGRKLGKGGFAVCFEGTLKRTSQVFAMKVVKSKVEQRKQLEKFRTELQIHAKMGHPNIVEFYRAFSFGEHTYVILELCSNGSLMEMVKNRSCLSLPEVRRYMIQLCGGVKYMHQRAIIHRDLKMGNLFLDAKMDLKIGDFGLAAIVVSEKERRQTLCGTPNYIAPEILDKRSGGGHDHKVDTWAIGIICYAMLTGGPPFASKTQPEIYAKLKQLEYSWKQDGLNFIPPQAKDLVTSCLTLTAQARPEMDDLVEHEFFKMGIIAEGLRASYRTEIPEWLQISDPRGDKVRSGYKGVQHEAICSTCGVGKTSIGGPRPSVGENGSKSVLSEVEIENKQGFAPVVPLPSGFVYRQFTAAKEDWTNARHYPIMPQTKSRSKKTTPATGLMEMGSVANALSDISAPANFTHTTRGPVQSFAAQQRQAALPSRVSSRATVPVVDETAKAEQEQAVTAESGRGYLRERPVRSASSISTRSNSTRQAVSSKASITKSSTVSEGIGRRLKSQLKASVEEILPDFNKPATLGRTSRRAVKENLETTRTQKSSLSPPNSSEFKENDVPEVPRPRTTETGERPRTARSIPEDTPRSTMVVLDHKEHTSLLRASRPREIISSLETIRDHLLGVHAAPTTRRGKSSNAPPIVEKWVDYTGRYGIAYIMTDHTVGCIFNATADNLRPSACIVVRDARSYYIQRAQRDPTAEVQQLLPQNGNPVEFYEYQGMEGLRKAIIPTSHFEMKVHQVDDKVSYEIDQTKIRTTYDQSKLNLVKLCDKFGKYMTKTLSQEELKESARAAKSQSFLKFYQRFGNVGIWGFSSSSSTASSAEANAFQVNFPDHTKVILYDNGALLDLYHMQPADTHQLARDGALSRAALERRSMTSLKTSDVLARPEESGLTTTQKDIVESNQIREKLGMIREIVEVWIKEKGLGRMGERDGEIYWKGLRDRHPSGRVKLVWNTVGRDGGDREALSRVVEDL